jgi:uncharacterized membrane protein SirB2
MDRAKIGLIGAAAAVGIAAIQLLPPFLRQPLPWLFLIGAALYFPFGAMGMILRTEEARKRRRWFWVFRLALVLILLAWLLANTPDQRTL